MNKETMLTLQELQCAVENVGGFDFGDFNFDTIQGALDYIEELEKEKIEISTGRGTGKTVETALILRKEILKLPEGRTYGIRRCKNNIICVIPEEVTLNSKIRDKIEELDEMKLDNDDIFGQMRNCAVLVLKELLEEEK